MNKLRFARSRLFAMSHNPYSTVNELRQNMYFGTEVLNRVSFLREDSEFIHASITHPSTRFIFFYKTDPLIYKNSEKKLITLTNGDGQYDADFKGLSRYEEWNKAVSTWAEDNRNQSSSIRDNKPGFLFMGIIDQSTGLNLSNLKKDNDNNYLDYQGRYQGIPFYAVDLTDSAQLSELVINHVKNGLVEIEHSDKGVNGGGSTGKQNDKSVEVGNLSGKSIDVSESSEETNSNLSSKLDKSKISKKPTEGASNEPIDSNSLTQPLSKSDSPEVFYTYSRKHFLTFPHTEAALFSHGKMYLDWLNRNRFCPGCGSKVIPINAGGKLYCINVEKTSNGKYVCPIKNTSVSNVSFPRTDSVIITAITNTEQTKILLSLSKRHSMTKMWSCTAGFMEPSETVEVATKREIWEETGVTCNDIKIVMTQPWPFPGNLMIGCIATVEFNGINEVIDLGHDGELSDAKWFDIETISRLAENEDVGLDMILPMSESISHSLIQLVLNQGISKKENKL